VAIQIGSDSFEIEGNGTIWEKGPLLDTSTIKSRMWIFLFPWQAGTMFPRKRKRFFL
jgi:hypothetical protein